MNQSSSSSAMSSTFQQGFRIAIWAVSIAVAILLCPQPPIENVVEEIALPLATAYVKGRGYQPPPPKDDDNDDTQPQQQPLQGIRVLITGPTSGIGWAMSTVLNDMGAEVIGVGRSESKLQEMMMLDETNNSNNNSILKGYHVADMSDLRSVAAAADQILEKYDRIDMMIANAGVHYHWTTMGSPETEQGLDLVFGGAC
jgi:NADPH:quinone reductase-like Zn-dependent oxidoreductase